MNKLFFGDCLDVLRNEIPDESVDLVYLDPPFNSNRDYNLLFGAPSGHKSEAQLAAFEDTWHWGEQAECEFRYILASNSTCVSEMLRSFRSFLGENDLMAYLTMMACRLLELKKVLRSTGSIYLHCDTNASHYLKVLMDSVLGPEHFRAEIVWKRFSSHGNTVKNYGRIHDAILYYSKSDDFIWNQVLTPLSSDYTEKHFRHIEAGTGRRYRLQNVLNPNKDRPNLTYEWHGHTRVWKWTREKMQLLHDAGKLEYSSTGYPALKQYLDESLGKKLQDVWDDLGSLSHGGAERLGYPTQKPLALLERLITASSSEGSVVLDPFCGCGTAVHAAQKLGRQWIGIDVTHLAISLIEKRLRDAFPGIEFEVHGTPKDLEGARNLASRDKYQFQWWACSLVGAQPWQDKKKGADRGIDGIIYFQDEKGIPKKIIVSVKGGETVGRAMIADLKNTVEREKAQIGLFVTLAAPTREMVKEALTAGFYDSPNFKSGEYPKIQILTIEGLLNATQRPRYPDLSQGTYTFKRATQELEAAQGEADLFK